MLRRLKNKRIAIAGGGRICKTFLENIRAEELQDQRPEVLGVADIDLEAVGLRYAAENGVFTTTDYRKLFELAGLELIIELTGNDFISETIRKEKPSGVRFMDHFEARAILDYLRIERKKISILKDIRQSDSGGGLEVERHLDHFWRYILDIARERNQYSQKIRNELKAGERTLAQIIQGSTIPTFVIDQNHIITHWNKACEKLTGYPAEALVGTSGQWKPFRRKARPIMADLILDGVDEEQVWRYYGAKWRKSALIEGAYEAEEFFPHLGENGKWLFFTAAPIKSPDGQIIGAIETLWDKTEDKRAEEERECHTQELAESERAMAQIIQGSTVATFVLDEDHVITHWNRAIEKLSGYPAEDMVGTQRHWAPFWNRERPTMADVVLDQMDETQIQQLYGNWRKSPLIEGAYEAEEFLPQLGENGKWCFFTAAPIRSPDGKIIGAIETLWDRTEYKKAEEERERHLTEISGLCSIYTALNTSLDLDLRIQSAIREIYNFLSADSVCIFLRREDGQFHLLYSHGALGDYCSSVQRAGAQSIVNRTAMGDEPIILEDLPSADNDEYGLLKKEGLRSVAYIPLNSKEKEALGVIRIGSNAPCHFSHEGKHLLELIGNRIGVAIENSMLHEKYIKSEEKYRSLFNNDPNPIFIIDSKTFEILDINERARDCYLYSRQELLGMSFFELGDESDQELIQQLSTIPENHSIFFSKKRHYRKERRPFYVNINVSRAKSGEEDILIANTTDISESLEKETQLIQASKMTTLGQMAAGIAHEINQPLNVIQVCTDFIMKMIRKGEVIKEEDLKTLANDMRNNVQRATGIIKHMRDFARQSEVVKRPVNINEPVMDVFKVLGHQMKVHQVELELDLDPNIPLIMAEHNRLEQVFINLVTNAIDAMDEKSRQDPPEDWKKLLTIKSSAINGKVLVSVRDTGVGMSREVKDKIFEPFFTTKEVGKGTGLGVSISYGIVKDYDGEIEIESEAGIGTCFKLIFPAADE